MGFIDDLKLRVSAGPSVDIDWSEFDAALYSGTPSGISTVPLDHFKACIVSASGEPIPLAGKTALEEPLSLTVRYGNNEDKVFCLLDVFAGHGEQMHPIGHYDWELLRDPSGREYALGDKNRHQQLPHVIPAHAKADYQWESKAFEVKQITWGRITDSVEEWKKLVDQKVITDLSQLHQPIYQGQGIGRFLIAASITALHHRGCHEMDLGSLNDLAKAAWRPFYPGVDGDSVKISSEFLNAHPLVNENLWRFLDQSLLNLPQPK